MSLAFDLASYNDVRANARQNPREALGWIDALRRPLAGGAGRALSQLGGRRLSGLKEEIITVDPVGRVCCNTKPRVDNSNDAIPTRSEYGLLSWALVCTSALKKLIHRPGHNRHARRPRRCWPCPARTTATAAAEQPA
jgi:hypothetical protein